MKNNRSRIKYSLSNAFSIVEILIYAAIFTMISVLVINSFITVSATFSTIKTNRDLMHSGLNITERMSREVHKANSIDLINSSLGSGVLYLNSLDESFNPVVVGFVYENNVLNFYRDGVVVGNLLSDNVVLDSLVFRRINTTKGEAIKVEMNIRDTKSKRNKAVNFYDTFILKGSY
ncbi:MAG: hypothetical protein PHT84_03085 [Candidatus Pacebacteria bacterium]|nr:hypothetical protein [Candidatus Paceibacterota bacterium]